MIDWGVTGLLGRPWLWMASASFMSVPSFCSANSLRRAWSSSSLCFSSSRRCRVSPSSEVAECRTCCADCNADLSFKRGVNDRHASEECNTDLSLRHLRHGCVLNIHTRNPPRLLRPHVRCLGRGRDFLFLIYRRTTAGMLLPLKTPSRELVAEIPPNDIFLSRRGCSIAAYHASPSRRDAKAVIFQQRQHRSINGRRHTLSFRWG